MKRIGILVLLVILPGVAMTAPARASLAQQIDAGEYFQVIVNPLQGTLNLAESLCDHPGAPAALKKRYEAQEQSDGTATRPSAQFCNLNLRMSVTTREGVATSLDRVLSTHTVRANTLEQLAEALPPSLSVQERATLMETIETLLPRYIELMAGEQEAVNTSARQLAAYLRDKQVSELLSSMEMLYDVKWPYEKPILVGLSPVPASDSFTASVNGATVFGDFPLGFQDFDAYTSVVLHEIGHALLEGQSASTKNYWNAGFTRAKQRTRLFAEAWFNEGLATAVGNGWSWKKLTGEVDPNQWYNNEVINRYSRAIAPRVFELLDKNQSISQGDLQWMSSAFDREFPDAFRLPDLVLAHADVHLPPTTADSEVQAFAGQWFGLVNARQFILTTDPVGTGTRLLPTVISIALDPQAPLPTKWTSTFNMQGQLVLATTLHDFGDVEAALKSLKQDIVDGRLMDNEVSPRSTTATCPASSVPAAAASATQWCSAGCNPLLTEIGG